MASPKHIIEDIYPLSPMQQGILFHTLYDSDSSVYFEQLSCLFAGDFNSAAFKHAWQMVAERHSTLRTAFVWEEVKEPLQVVQHEARLIWEELDWRGFAATEQPRQLEDFLRADRRRGMEIARAPLMRFILIRRAERAYHFIWSHHHLVLDGWSVSLVLKEMLMIYAALCRSEQPYLEPARPYGDYIEWLLQQDKAKAEAYWRGWLNGFTAPTPLPMDRAPEGAMDQAQIHDRQRITLPAAFTAALTAAVRQHRLTLNTLVQGAWALLLGRYADRPDVVFGVTVSGRPEVLAGVESMIGIFINTLPLRAHLPADKPLRQWLKDLQERQSEMRQYEYSSLVQIQGWSEVPRSLPLFDSIVVFENYPVDPAVARREWLQSLNLNVSEIRTSDLITYPLSLGVEPGDELTLMIAYDPRRFDHDMVSRMLDHLRDVLESYLTDPEQRLAEITFLKDSERRQLLSDWNDTRIAYPEGVAIHEMIEAQARRTPHSTALVFNNQRLTYRELSRQSNRLAYELLRSGVGPDRLVGILMERSLEMVIALLGVLKAGGAYVPLDPAYPHERLAAILEEADPTVILAQAYLIDRLPSHRAPVICLDASVEAIAGAAETPPDTAVSGKSLAYVIYTSGSTGRPKGVMNTHEGIYNRLMWMQDAYRLTPADRVLHKTPFSFDVSVWEFFWPLMNGACLIIAEPGGHQDSSYLVRLIAEKEITLAHFVPSMLRVFLEDKRLDTCRSLRHVICSGESLPVELQEQFFSRLNTALHNLYGPTEAAVDVTFWRCESKDGRRLVPIGRPIANTQIYLLDPDGRPVPVGVPGELHIGGIGLARGYLHRPDLTAEKFVPDPFANQPCARLYKTGDLARYRPDGNIEFLGRIDHQVKIRGLRIELAEIEGTLLLHEKIRQAVVVAREDSPGNQQLVAYLVLAQRSDGIINEARSRLQQKLPEYMVPTAFVLLDSLPLTPSGKLDRRNLPAPSLGRAGLDTRTIAPRTRPEKELTQVWRELLGVEQIGINDNFFELGGHSLLFTQMASRIREIFHVEMPLRILFNVPTVSEMIAAIAEKQIEQEDAHKVAQMLDDLKQLSPEQVRMLLEAEGELSM